MKGSDALLHDQPTPNAAPEGHGARPGERLRWPALLRALIGSALRPFALGAALAALTVWMGMALLGVSGWFITATALAGLQAATAIGFDVFMSSAAIRLLALGRTLSRYGERWVTHDATFGALADLRVRLFRAWAGPEAAQRLLARPSRLLFRLTSDIDALESLYLAGVVPALAAMGAALLAALVMGWMHAGMGWFLLGWLLLAGWGLAWRTWMQARRPALQRAQAMELLRARTIDLVSGQTELVLVGQLAAQRQALQSADRRMARADERLNRLDIQAGLGFGLAGSLTLAGLLVAVALLCERGIIAAPSAALVLLMGLTAMEPFGALRRGALSAGRSWLAVRRLTPPAAAADLAHPDRTFVSLGVDPELLRLDHIDACHPGARTMVLRDFSWQMQAGERVALIGPSGAGKSSVLALVAGELQLCQGRRQVNVRPGLLTQRTELFQDSLRDNLRLARPDADDSRLWQVLQDAGLAADVKALAQGLDTRLGEGGLGLSAGQMRRLTLARLLLQDRPLWLLDEPTEALDAAVATDVLQRLAQQSRGRSLLIATHLRREAALADRLLCLRGGRIEAELRRGEPAFDAALETLRPD